MESPGKTPGLSIHVGEEYSMIKGYQFYLLIVPILIIVLLLQLDRLRKHTASSLQEVLYISENPGLYFQLLENPHLKFLFTSTALMKFQLDGFIYEDDMPKVVELENQLRNAHPAKGDRMEMETALLSYWCRKNNRSEAEKALAQIDLLYANVRKPVNQEIQKDAHRIYRIYIEHDLTIVPELKELAAQQEGGQKAVTLFRIAKLQDQAEALDTLRLALPLSRGTAYEPIIQTCIDDPDKRFEY